MARFKQIVFLCLLIGAIPFAVSWGRDIVGEIEFKQTHSQALANHVQSQRRLAMLYEKGMFTETDEAQAIYWYKIAAGNGSRTAQNILCRKYKLNCEDLK